MNGNANIEKRATRRQALFLYLKVYDHKNHDFLGYLTDISPEGLMILSEIPIDLKQTIMLEIDCSAELPSTGSVVLCAHSVWTGKDANPKYLITGFEFTDMDESSLDAVHLLIDTYGFTT